MGASKRKKFSTLNQIDKELTDGIKIDLVYSGIWISYMVQMIV